MTSTRITEIRLSPGESSEDDVYELCSGIDHFVEIAIEEFGYEPGELPEGAYDFIHLWKYHGEYLNGGHAQYAGNTDFDVTAWSSALCALKRLDRPDYAAILEEFIQFATENEDRIFELYEEDEQAADALFRGFDDRFYALEEQGSGLQDAIHRWLVAQEWLIVDRSLPSSTVIRLRQSILPHPLREERLAERDRRFVAENQTVGQAMLDELRKQLDRNSKL